MQLCLAFSPPNSLTECRELWCPAWDGANGRKEFAAPTSINITKATCKQLVLQLTSKCPLCKSLLLRDLFVTAACMT